MSERNHDRGVDVEKGVEWGEEKITERESRLHLLKWSFKFTLHDACVCVSVWVEGESDQNAATITFINQVLIISQSFNIQKGKTLGYKDIFFSKGTMQVSITSITAI